MADDTGPTPWTRRGAGPSGPTGDETVAHPPLAVPEGPADAPTVSEGSAPAPPRPDDPTVATPRGEGPPPRSQERPPATPPPPGRGKGKGNGVDPLTAVAVGGVVVLAVAVIIAVVAMRSADDDSSADGTTTTAAVTTTTDASESTDTSTPDTDAPSSSDGATTLPVDAPTQAELGADLQCADLVEAGASYSQAVVYWATHGESALLDSDGDGIPCETTYASSDVAFLWRESDDPTVTDGLAEGLFCRDLVAQDVSYADAVGYWAAQGRPDRMDDDGNGVPCETTYDAADVEAFWG